jgi:cytochrome c oxidase subunit 3
MFVEMRLVFNRFFLWLSRFPFQWWSWREAFQKRYGNIYDIHPVGGNIVRFPKHHHSFHILGPSPWPLCVSMSLLILVSGLLDFLNVETYWGFSLLLGFFELLLCLWCWWGDVVTESLTEHTKQIKYGIAVGMVLFIVSEVMFFFSFFWAFFHVSLAPGIEIGCVWPPKGLEYLVISPWGAPLLNTVVLLSSGVTITCAHYAFLAYCYKQRKFANFLNAFGEFLALKGVTFVFNFNLLTGKDSLSYVTVLRVLGYRLLTFFKQIRLKFFYRIIHIKLLDSHFINCFNYFSYTLILAVFFTFSQGIEYVESPISMSDGVYGSTFFVMTGFHGFHVIVGTIFLTVCFLRILLHRYSYVHFIGLECAIWYWHFVDVVWLFLFLFVYYWGNAFIPNIDFRVFGKDIAADFASNFQLDFQDSASVLMESIVDLHNYIVFYLWIVLGIVSWMLFAFAILTPGSQFNSTLLLLKLLFFDIKQRELISRRLYFMYSEHKNRAFNRLFEIDGIATYKKNPTWKEIFRKFEEEKEKKEQEERERKKKAKVKRNAS